MALWSGSITITIDMDSFEADSQEDAEQYLEMNWDEYLYRSTVEDISVASIEEVEDSLLEDIEE